MALTSQTTFDVVGQSQTIVFNNPGSIDQIQFSSGAITFGAISSYNLSKSDMFLYNKYLQAFNTLLLFNFPSISANIGQIWPLCNFQINETFAGVTHLTYNQTSSGTTVCNINYVPQVVSAAFTARVSPVTITVQEYFMFVLMLAQFSQQVNLN